MTVRHRVAWNPRPPPPSVSFPDATNAPSPAVHCRFGACGRRKRGRQGPRCSTERRPISPDGDGLRVGILRVAGYNTGSSRAIPKHIVHRTRTGVDPGAARDTHSALVAGREMRVPAREGRPRQCVTSPPSGRRDVCWPSHCWRVAVPIPSRRFRAALRRRVSYP